MALRAQLAGAELVHRDNSRSSLQRSTEALDWYRRVAVDVVLATPIAIPNQHMRAWIWHHAPRQCVKRHHLHSATEETPLAEAVACTERDEEVDVPPVDLQAVQVLEPVRPLVHPRPVSILGSADLDDVLARRAITISSLGSASHSMSCSTGRSDFCFFFPARFSFICCFLTSLTVSSQSDIGRDSSTEALQPLVVIWFANIRLAKCTFVLTSIALNWRREMPES